MDKDLFELFKDFTDDKFKEISHRLNRIDRKLDDMNSFKWKIIGISVGMVTVTTFIMKFYGRG